MKSPFSLHQQLRAQYPWLVKGPQPTPLIVPPPTIPQRCCDAAERCGCSGWTCKTHGQACTGWSHD